MHLQFLIDDDVVNANLELRLISFHFSVTYSFQLLYYPRHRLGAKLSSEPSLVRSRIDTM